MSTILDPLAFPLRGSRLIEASAGTGKTFTLALLYLRLVLGHGDADSAFDRPLSPPDILVVTFTEAATQELRDRVRQRLVEAADVFATPPGTSATPAPDGDVLLALRASYPPDAWPGCAHRLRAAADWMDDAAISTIHGWCNRMLREHAFDTRGLFERALATDQSELIAEIVRDYWRIHFYPLAPEPAARILEIVGSPADLEQRLQGWLKHAGLPLSHRGRPLRVGSLAALLADPPADGNAPPLAVALLAHAADWLQAELGARLLQRAEMGFDDLLTQLDAALDPARGAAADRLAATIRAQFPAALIDEFQDTDPIQYRIFDRIHDVRAARPDTALVMIGDPKQAIYGFRGADIHAYLEARAATRGRHYTLARNFRSTHAVVRACNALFAHAETHARGAFRFKTATDNPIPFQPVASAGQAERLILDGEAAPPLTCWMLEDGEPVVPLARYRERMAGAAATRVAGWLGQADQNRAGFVDEVSGAFRPLRPRDIAILVRGRTEAAAVRAALAARRVASVYLSDRDSVFQAAEAGDLLTWLRACAAPTDESLARAALLTNTLALPLTDLAALFGDELAWENQMERFRDYQFLWRRRGVLAMLYRLMQDTGLPGRLLGRDGGERILTNLLHLAEWLQQAASGIDGEQALIRHLAEHLGTTDEEQILRLESDAELVRVITIHKSKGLEYPLVLLPFICGWKAVDGHTRQVLYRTGSERFLEIAGKDGFKDAWTAADDERLGEDMRLLYVALTRARHGLWLGIAPLRQGNAKKSQLEKSALGHLLAGGAALGTPRAIREILETIQEKTRRDGAPAIAIEPAPVPTPDPLVTGPPPALEPARPAPAWQHRPWWITSYSALKQGARLERDDDGAPAQPAARVAVETASEETALEEAGLDTPSGSGSPPRPDGDGGPHDFPAGTRYGTFLHGILEWAARHPPAPDAAGRVRRGFAAAAASPASRRRMLEQRCPPRGLAAWTGMLDAWLGELLARPWRLAGSPPLILADLDPRGYQVEFEFWMESRAVSLQSVDRLTCRHTLANRARPALEPLRFNGMLKGFIDLVFEHAGRHYVLDWKSDRLGADSAAYAPGHLAETVGSRRYDLQYVLYLLALHRQLRARLPGYDYDAHVGGALCVFLRGGQAATQGVFMDRPPRQLIETLDRLFMGLETTP